MRMACQEAVAGVHRLGARLADDLENALGVQVALGGGRAAEPVRLAGAAHVERVAIGLGVHRDRRDAELLECADDAHGDLPAIGDQDLAEHRARRLLARPRRPRPGSSPEDRKFPAARALWTTRHRREPSRADRLRRATDAHVPTTAQAVAPSSVPHDGPGSETGAAGELPRRRPGYSTSRRSAAHRDSSWRLDSCSLRRTADTCASTVFAEMPRRRAISL